METTGRARSLAGMAALCVLALVAGWLVGRLDLVLAVGLGIAIATVATSVGVSTTSTTRLTAVTSEPADGWREFHRELARARRFERSFGIVRFVGVDRSVVGDRRLRDQVASLARRIDRVWLDGADLFVLMPESDSPAVETAVARVRYRIGTALDDAITATFPINGITSGSLLSCLYQGDASPVAIGALALVPADSSSSSPEAEALAETAT